MGIPWSLRPDYFEFAAQATQAPPIITELQSRKHHLENHKLDTEQRLKEWCLGSRKADPVAAYGEEDEEMPMGYQPEYAAIQLEMTPTYPWDLHMLEVRWKHFMELATTVAQLA